jgi:rubredoxin
MAEKLKCSLCGHIYNSDKGDAGVEPGTLFSEVPNDWRCPVCGANKSDFVKTE